MPLLNGNFENGLMGWAQWVKRGHPVGGVVPRGFMEGSGFAYQTEGHHETYEVGILQGVSGGPLSKFTLSAHFRFKLSDHKEDPNLTGIRGWVGIDPSGGTSPDSSGLVIVSGDVGRFNYERLVVNAESIQGAVTCFCGVEAGVGNQWPIENLLAYIADVRLAITPGVEVPPPPNPIPNIAGVAIEEAIEFLGYWEITLRVPKVK